MKGIKREKLKDFLFEIMFKENNRKNLFIEILELISKFEYR